MTNKILKLNVYLHPEQTFVEWSSTLGSFYERGIHVLKDGSSYIRMSTTSNYYLSVVDTQMLQTAFQADLLETLSAPTNGISEEALLAALAIAQDPSLAVGILALRKQ